MKEKLFQLRLFDLSIIVLNNEFWKEDSYNGPVQLQFQYPEVGIVRDHFLRNSTAPLSDLIAL
jgi:hypothetical protein